MLKITQSTRFAINTTLLHSFSVLNFCVLEYLVRFNAFPYKTTLESKSARQLKPGVKTIRKGQGLKSLKENHP